MIVKFGLMMAKINYLEQKQFFRHTSIDLFL